MSDLNMQQGWLLSNSDVDLTTEGYFSTSPGYTEPPVEGANVGLIVGLSIGIPALLTVLGFLLYKTRTKWIKYCPSYCGNRHNKLVQSRRSSLSNENSVPTFPEISPPPPPLPDRVSSQPYRPSTNGPYSSRNAIPLNAQTLLIDLSSDSDIPNHAVARLNSHESAGELSSIIFPPTLPPRPSSARSQPPQLQQGKTDLLTSIVPGERYPLTSPTLVTNHKIAAEFSKLRFVTLPCTVASSPENKIKNRFMDTFPFDFNRVVLSSGQYINASHIGSEFIVTQDPMMVVDDDDILWSMVWEKEVAIIVRLSSDDLGSNTQLGAAPYMPVGRFVFNNNLEVKLVSGPSDESQYVYRAVILAKTAGRDRGERQVEHYHLKNWNSNKPPPALDLLKALCVIRERHKALRQQTQDNRDIRVLVHCGAGSSRSGTFVAVWKCMDFIDLSSTPNVFNVVQDIRSQRTQAVNKLELYEYIHQCVNLYTKKRDELAGSGTYDVYSVSGGSVF